MMHFPDVPAPGERRHRGIVAFGLAVR
jgi:hypothetical protein